VLPDVPGHRVTAHYWWRFSFTDSTLGTGTMPSTFSVASSSRPIRLALSGAQVSLRYAQVVRPRLVGVTIGHGPSVEHRSRLQRVSLLPSSREQIQVAKADAVGLVGPAVLSVEDPSTERSPLAPVCRSDKALYG
jgi:hypothetical protein